MDKNDEPEGQSAAPVGTLATSNTTTAGASAEPAIEISVSQAAKTERVASADKPPQSGDPAQADPLKSKAPKPDTWKELPWGTGRAQQGVALDMSPAGIDGCAAAVKDNKDRQVKLERKRPIRKFVALDLDWFKSLVAQQGVADDAAIEAAIESASSPRPADPAPLVAPIPPENDRPRGRAVALLAASVALAAAVGALAGAFGASHVAARSTPLPEASPVSTASTDVQALKATVAQLRTDIGALRTAVETATKAANAQSAKVTERFDRLDRARSEPPAWVNKAVETLERLERRADANAAKETTGAVSAAPVAQASAPPVVPGWILRDVQRGVALIQGPRIGLIEVEAGDVVPILGRIESIHKQDGRWVVTTTKGIITASR